MKPILIVKLGETMPALAQSHGDFENWLEARLHLGKSQLVMADPRGTAAGTAPSRRCHLDRFALDGDRPRRLE